MTKYEFYDYIKNQNIDKQIEVEFQGNTISGFYSKQDYIYLIHIDYFGEDNNIKSSSYSSWQNENKFYIKYNDIMIEINYKDIRTFLDVSYSKLLTMDDIKNSPEHIKDILKNGKKVLSCEYGLKEKIKYYLIFHYDNFYIKDTDEPKKKTNLVLWISDKPFIDGKAQNELTPNYTGWSY